MCIKFEASVTNTSSAFGINVRKKYDSEMHNTGGSRLSQIFWEHENLSGLSIIWLIQLL